MAKAEHLAKGPNPRFIVTSLTSKMAAARELYEKIYCARGEMENRIKECQLDLMADRTSTATLRANQLRLWFSSLAYVLVTALRRLALAGTELENRRNHPAEAPEAWCAGYGQRKAHQDRHRLSLSAAACLCNGTGPIIRSRRLMRPAGPYASKQQTSLD